MGFRPGLKPNKYYYLNENNYSKSNLGKCRDFYGWKHIYNCYKIKYEKIYRFTEFYFLCNEWFFGEEVLEIYYEGYINNLKIFSVYFDPFVYNGVLAMSEFCYHCFAKPSLPVSKRMYQFKNRPKWLIYNETYIDHSKPITCYYRML